MGNYTEQQTNQMIDLVRDLFFNSEREPGEAEEILNGFLSRAEEILFPVLTVRDLMKRMEGLNPDTAIVVESSGWYRYVTSAARPEGSVGGTSGFGALTLQMGENVDPRDGQMFVPQERDYCSSCGNVITIRTGRSRGMMPDSWPDFTGWSNEGKRKYAASLARSIAEITPTVEAIPESVCEDLSRVLMALQSVHAAEQGDQV